MKKLDKNQVFIYALSVIGSGCGFLSQILISGYWSSAFSQDVFFFSINTAFYFLSLGLGSLQSERILRPAREHLVGLVLFLCFWTAASVPILKYFIQEYGNFFLIPTAQVFISGFVAGQIIPLCLRLEESRNKINLSMLFFLDYTAAIAFTFLFTFVLLIPLGYLRTSMVLAFTCLSLTVILMIFNKEKSRYLWGAAVATLGLPLLILVLQPPPKSAPGWRSGNNKPARVVFKQQTHYQKIILTEETGNNPYYPDQLEHVLYLDGFIQFNSLYEQAYHFCLANVPILAADYLEAPPKKALILGGGDGLVARNLLETPSITQIDQVELDPAMVELAKHEPHVRKYNKDAFYNDRVNIIVADAFRWVRTAEPQSYDLIIIDFPDPKSITLSRLYSSEFYSYVWKLLSPKGFLSIQSGPVYALEDESKQTLSRVTTTVMKTLASVGKASYVYYNPRDLDAFVMATPYPEFDMDAFSEKIGIRADIADAHFCKYKRFWKIPDVKVNTLNTLPMTEYLLHWYEQAGGFFRYGDNYAIFLPE